MDSTLAHRLCALNNAFYAQNAASFSATRQQPWPGWQHLLDLIGERARQRIHSVLDLACGNLRFADFLAQTLPGQPIAYYGVDNCEELCVESSFPRPTSSFPRMRESTVEATYQHLDICAELEGGRPLAAALRAPACDVAVCFAFLHHLPLPEWRAAVLDALLARTSPGGYAAVSLWQFAQDSKLLAKAQATAAQAQRELGLDGLAPGDFILGWQDQSASYRYCHSFSEADIAALIDHVSARAPLIGRFNADGRGGALNCYLLFQCL
jgi:SAM-dependent methyltransferase